jgi:hypothetical protein
VKIYYDALQEGQWFQNLHPDLAAATLHTFPPVARAPAGVATALAYDRPDIILTDDSDNPILILERTIEVPSGHNVGQRFPRLVGAAKMQVPSVFFVPYKAYKHGGETAGPRFINLRLFLAAKEVERIEGTVLTIINWPVDAACEVIQTPAKDVRVIDYLKLFFTYYNAHGMNGIGNHIKTSAFEVAQESERTAFIKADVRRPAQYNGPPPSVKIGKTLSLTPLAGANTTALKFPDTVLYKIGMNNMRSDPYTGTSFVYSYLYCGGHPPRTHNMVLHFPGISIAKWRAIGNAGGRKEERLFKIVADGILFSNGYLPKASL